MTHQRINFYGRRIISLILVFALLAASYTLPCANTYAADKGTVIADALNVRTKPNTKSDVITSLATGTKVTITNTKTNAAGEEWYKIKVTVNGTTYKGFVMASYIKKAKSTATTEAATTTKATATTKASATTERTATVLTRYATCKKATVIYGSRSTSSSRIAYLKKGTVVTAFAKKKVNNKTWYQVRTTGLSRVYSGYMPASKLTLQKVKTASNKYSVALTTKKSSIFKTANDTDEQLGVVKKNKDMILLGTLKVGGVKWAKVKTSVGTGYILFSRIAKVTGTVKNSLNLSATVSTKSGTRKVASLLATNLATAQVGTTVTVTGRLTVNKVEWYKVTWDDNGNPVTGYIRASAIELSEDAIFQESLKNFPESYHAGLTALHAAHPSWIFNAVNTGLAWSDVIAGENVSGRNTIESNCPSGGSASTYSAPFSYLSTAAGDYDWASDTYTLRDGSNWYTANDQVIAYYMDPRNFLTDTGIFQFEALSYESTQSETVVQTMLANTFMSGGYSVTDALTGQTAAGNYSTAFMDAAVQSGVSPYYLVSRVKNEVGSSGSGSTSGTYSGYEGYYNFYNIGANDSSTGQAVANGLAWAKKGTTYNRPWTTPYKSITGGAQYIAKQYISLGQNTMYTQKFNVVVPTSYYVHQYMTAVTAANSYAVTNYNSYTTGGILDNAYTFYIPYYTDMPETVCQLPESAGNPNSYLKKLTVKNTANNATITLNATFDYATLNYTAVVANSVSSIKVSATKISSYAKVGGTGTYTLAVGDNTFTITCTAGNGTKTKYKLTITRQSA